MLRSLVRYLACILLLFQLAHAFSVAPSRLLSPPLGGSGATAGAQSSILQHRYAPKLRRSAKMSTTRIGLDLDSFRNTFRAGVQVSTAGVSLVTLYSLLSQAVKQQKEGSQSLNLAVVQSWLSGLSVEETQKLYLCLALDLFGASPEILFPGILGESIDAVWAPIYAFLLFQSFGDRGFVYKSTLAVGGFLEEILPFASIIPSATIGWFLETNAKKLERSLSRNLDDQSTKDMDKPNKE